MKFLGPPSSGSIAAVTFSRNSYGQYQRARVGRGGVPAFPLTQAVADWQALSSDQQRGWQSWATLNARQGSLGQSRPLSGYLMYLSQWQLLTLGGGVPLADAPFARSPAIVVAATLSLFSAPRTVELRIDTAGNAGLWEIQWVSPWSSGGTNFPPGRGATWVSEWPGSVAGGSFATHQRVYGAPPGPRRVFARTRLVGSDGMTTAFVYASPVAIS